MGVMESVRKKPAVGGIVAGGLVVLAAGIVAYSYWPAHHTRFDQAFLSEDDGRSWFVDSMTLVPPVQHDGKEAVFAHIFSYDDGSKQFCAYLTKFTPAAKQKLEASIQAAVAAHRPASSAPLYADRNFMRSATLVKRPGGGDWVAITDPRSTEIMSPKSPDGSVVDQVLAD